VGTGGRTRSASAGSFGGSDVSRSAKSKKKPRRKWKGALKAVGASRLRAKTRQYLKNADLEATVAPSKLDGADRWSFD
jgi:hypothetical protein